MKFLTAFLNLLSSTWFGVGLMTLAILYMSLGSALPSIRQYYELTETGWFQTPVFLVLLALIVLSMLVATLRRVALTRAKLGAWLAHAGAIILCTGAVIYFGHKIEGDVEIPRRAVEIKLPGAAPVRLPAIVGLSAVARDAHPNGSLYSKPDLSISSEWKRTTTRPAETELAREVSLPDHTWQLKVININPTAQSSVPKKLYDEMAKKKIARIYQVDLQVDHPSDINYKVSVFDGFEKFNDFSDALLRVGTDDEALAELYFQARCVPDPAKYFYLRESAALYMQIQKFIPASQNVKNNQVGSQPAMAPICWFPASRLNLFTPTELLFNDNDFRSLYPLDRNDDAWTQYPLTGRLPLYREAFDPQLDNLSPPQQLAQLAWYQTPHLQILVIGLLLVASAGFSVLVFPERFRRPVWMFYGALGIVLIGLLAYRWEINSRTLIYNHGPLNIPVTCAGDALQIRVTGYLPYTDGEHLVPKALRQPLRDMGRLMSMIQVELSRGDWREIFWLPFVDNLHLAQFQQVGVAEVPGLGLVRLAYGRERLPLPEPIALVDFIHEKGLGGETSADFISLLAVGDPAKGPVKQGPDIKTQLNEPYRDGTYHYYQAAYDPQFLSSTTLMVTNREGLWIMLTGIVLMVLGMIWAFYLKPGLLMKDGQ